MLRLAHLAVLVAGSWQLATWLRAGGRRLLDQVLDEATRDFGQGGRP